MALKITAVHKSWVHQNFVCLQLEVNRRVPCLEADNMNCCKQLLLLAVALVQCAEGQTPADTDASRAQLLALYKVIRNIALPSDDLNLPQEQRLVLLLPGKILSFDSYYPGDDYVKSLQGQDKEAGYLEIPPRIMQNMFRLSDAVPGLNPFRGADTGLSMSALYRDIISSLDMKGFDELSANQKIRQKKSIEYLTERVRDPVADSEITRLSLYRRYQEKYNDAREKMEKEIEAKRLDLPSLDYQVWFQREYPIMQSGVEGAYLEWLVFGDKENVELHKSRLDTSSPGLLLLEAKSSLRSSGYTSLDRTQTVYPVSFVPGDWYKYLLNRPPPMTREQLLQRIKDLEGQRIILVEAKTASGTANCKEIMAGAITGATGKNTELTASIKNKVVNATAEKCHCIQQAYDKPETQRSSLSHCVTYEKSVADVLAEATNQGLAATNLEELQSVINGADSNVIDNILNTLNTEIDNLQGQLALAPVSDEALTSFSGAPYDPTDKWLQFEYSSERDQQAVTKSSYDTTYSSYARSASSSRSYGWWWRRNYASSSSTRSSYSSYSGTHAFSRLTKSKIKVKGKLLRVIIQRPWFRPEIFKNKRFKILNDRFQVSPGFLKESEFLEKTTKGDYYLPQYTTGLLLAREIEMEFSGVDKSTAASIIRSSHTSYAASSSSGSSGWGCFSFASRSDYTSSYSAQRSYSASFQASSTASGLKIAIPGVQVIGYYTQIVDKFPKVDENA